MVKFDVSEMTYGCLMTYLRGEPYSKEQLTHLFEAPGGCIHIKDMTTLDDIVRHLLDVSYSEGL